MVAVPLMFLSAVMDEAHRTQESLRSIGAKLINAQDQERSRIARELHDDYNQRLAMLAIDLEKLVGLLAGNSQNNRAYKLTLFTGTFLAVFRQTLHFVFFGSPKKHYEMSRGTVGPTKLWFSLNS